MADGATARGAIGLWCLATSLGGYLGKWLWVWQRLDRGTCRKWLLSLVGVDLVLVGESWQLSPLDELDSVSEDEETFSVVTISVGEGGGES